MKQIFIIIDEIELKELMLQIGIRKIHTFEDSISFPCEITLVGNEQEKFLWA